MLHIGAKAIYIYKLGTVSSHDHFQFQFMQIFYSIDPEKFSMETCFQKKSLNVIVTF